MCHDAFGQVAVAVDQPAIDVERLARLREQCRELVPVREARGRLRP